MKQDELIEAIQNWQSEDKEERRAFLVIANGDNCGCLIVGGIKQLLCSISAAYIDKDMAETLCRVAMHIADDYKRKQAETRGQSTREDSNGHTMK